MVKKIEIKEGLFDYIWKYAIPGTSLGGILLVDKFDASVAQKLSEVLDDSQINCPHLRIKTIMALLERGCISHKQVATSLGIKIRYWLDFYYNYRQGNLARIPNSLREAVPLEQWPFLAGFTDCQLGLLENALRIPFLMAESIDDEHLLLQELKILLVFGVLLLGKHNQFNKYSFRIDW